MCSRPAPSLCLLTVFYQLPNPAGWDVTQGPHPQICYQPDVTSVSVKRYRRRHTHILKPTQFLTCYNSWYSLQSQDQSELQPALQIQLPVETQLVLQPPELHLRVSVVCPSFGELSIQEGVKALWSQGLMINGEITMCKVLTVLVLDTDRKTDIYIDMKCCEVKCFIYCTWSQCILQAGETTEGKNTNFF